MNKLGAESIDGGPKHRHLIPALVPVYACLEPFGYAIMRLASGLNHGELGLDDAFRK